MSLQTYLKQLSILAAMAAPLSAQALISHSVAMTGGSVAGTVAGKKVSDSLDAIMGQVSGVTATAAKTGPKVVSKATPASTPVAKSAPIAGAPIAGGPVGTSTGKRRVKRTAAAIMDATPTPAATMIAPTKPALKRNETAYALSRWIPAGQTADTATVEKLAAVKEGESTEDLGAELGIPSSRVMIPGNDGQLLQRVKYKNSVGKDVGIVYLADGKVVNVEMASR